MGTRGRMALAWPALSVTFCGSPGGGGASCGANANREQHCQKMINKGFFITLFVDYGVRFHVTLQFFCGLELLFVTTNLWDWPSVASNLASHFVGSRTSI